MLMVFVGTQSTEEFKKLLEDGRVRMLRPIQCWLAVELLALSPVAAERPAKVSVP